MTKEQEKQIIDEKDKEIAFLKSLPIQQPDQEAELEHKAWEYMVKYDCTPECAFASVVGFFCYRDEFRKGTAK